MAPAATVLPPLLHDPGLDVPAASRAISLGPSHEPDDDSTIRTVGELVRRRAVSHPDRVIVSYPSSGIDYVDYTMQQLDVFAYRVATGYQRIIPTRTSSADPPTVVALLGPSDLDYIVTMLALVKLGHTVLFLSTRISPAAIASLISTTSANVLLAAPAHAEVARATQQGIQGLVVDEIAPRSTYEFPIEVHANTRLDQTLDPCTETNNVVYIIHSSGSTGLPKPIYQTHKAAIANYAVSMEMRAFITLPLYHNHGICNFFRAVYSGKSLHVYNASLPLTHDHLVSIMTRHRFEIFYGVPYALKLLAESDKGIQILRSLKIVMYGGSACPDELGDRLVDCGVNLVGHYGATEVGQLMTSFRSPNDKAWNYVRETDKLRPYLEWIPRGPNLFECAVKDGWPAKIASNQPDGSYRTKDLFEPHPAIPGAWKYIARSDDTIVLVNGEKFNPVQLEGNVRSDHRVAEAVVFGAGRPSLGILIVPAPGLAHVAADEVRELVWPVVQRAQADAESYARISREMVCVLPADCACPRTDKGSVIRQAFYKAFAAEIDAAYDAADRGSGELSVMSEHELRQFLREALAQVAGPALATVSDDTDFFLVGLDSLRALQVRSLILRSVDLGGKSLGQNAVFDFPSIDKLSLHLLALAGGQEAKRQDTVEDDMRALIEKLGNFHPREPQSVVVTGATGSLGAHVVACVLRDPSVGTVYCLVRAASNEEAARRLKESLLQRRLYHTIPASSARRVVVLKSDLSHPTLGLGTETYSTVTEKLGAVIHCAWSVNFNLHLSSFEKTNLAGVVNLIALTRRAGQHATFNFCSSVSATARCPLAAVPETIPDLAWSQAMGYAQSKSVAEHLCARAAEQAGVRTRVLRVGQIMADTKHGVWNHTEAIPLMIQSATTVGALPKLQETPSWLPVDTVGRAVAEIALSDAGSVVANVTNPQSFRWTEDLLPALKTAGLEFDEVEPREWVRRLRASNQDPQANPPIKLVDFFASKYDRDGSASSTSFATDVARSFSPSLADAPVLNPDLVAKFVKYFRTSAWSVAANKATATTATTPASDCHPCPRRRTVIVMAGPCGSGKSTIGRAVAAWLGAPFIEGDSLHGRDAIARMAAGTALTDADRAAWLWRAARHAAETVADMGYPAVVLSCSALRRVYRDALREGIARAVGGGAGGEEIEVRVRVVVVDLQAAPGVLEGRMRLRKGHYMAPEMVPGQVAAHEPAEEDEVDVLPVDCEGPVEAVVDEVKWLIGWVAPSAAGVPGSA
ncbi:acetyl-CoA synthetase-like protein [Parathielavia hyrcaniae]|uniref:gluconokinase n=1 Tax=Parathielavia hyrcaniae TaxID=113614 RepID=A0AAN6SXF7_9PEZI|nr:acetyl-CoA synthetase-like protein [Parathielavia hyrcaniae]